MQVHYPLFWPQTFKVCTPAIHSSYLTWFFNYRKFTSEQYCKPWSLGYLSRSVHLYYIPIKNLCNQVGKENYNYIYIMFIICLWSVYLADQMSTQHAYAALIYFKFGKILRCITKEFKVLTIPPRIYRSYKFCNTIWTIRKMYRLFVLFLCVLFCKLQA